jgi:polysaccharide export outer membrane protein
MEIEVQGLKLCSKHVTIMEAIANAGDITITGNRKAVTIIRNANGIQMHDLDLTDINVMNSPYFFTA